MRGNRIIICFSSLCLILLVFLAGSFDDVPEVEMSGTILFQIGTGENSERIQCWENDQNTLYVFLPSYSELSDIWIQTEGDCRFLIEGSEVRPGDSCADYVLDQPYLMTMQDGSRISQRKLIFKKSGQIPAMYIDVQSGNMEYIHLDKNNEETGSLRLYGSDGQLSYSGTMKLKGRGNSSWGAEKKPYNLMLEEEADLFGMGTAGNWVLLAEGYNPAVIRNKIVYDFAREAGLKYSPECQWVDLYLNGEYAGLYELSEKNEIHPERVNISQENGGFLVSMEYESRLREQKYPYVLTEAGQALRVRSGTTEMDVMERHWQTVENAILAEDGVDPVSGKHWNELIDLDSWARKYLIEEIFGNLDAGSLSQFYYYDAGSSSEKIYAGPVWDYDFSMGGEDVWLKPYTDYFVMNRVYVNEDVFTPWFPALCQQEEFLSKVKEIYILEFLPLLQELTAERIQNYWETVRMAAVLDSVRWDKPWDAVQQEHIYIQNFLEKRMAFLADIWISEAEYHTVYVDPGRYGIYGCFAVQNGDVLPSLPTAEELSGLGWYRKDSDEPFDISQPIVADMHLYMKIPETNLPAIHLAPLFAMAVFLTGLAVVGSHRNKQNRRGSHDTAPTA